MVQSFDHVSSYWPKRLIAAFAEGLCRAGPVPAPPPADWLIDATVWRRRPSGLLLEAPPRPGPASPRPRPRALAAALADRLAPASAIGSGWWLQFGGVHTALAWAGRAGRPGREQVPQLDPSPTGSSAFRSRWPLECAMDSQSGETGAESDYRSKRNRAGRSDLLPRPRSAFPGGSPGGSSKNGPGAALSQHRCSGLIWWPAAIPKARAALHPATRTFQALRHRRQR